MRAGLNHERVAEMKATSERHLCGRGFLLLVIVGILAVLLVICVGFLSFTRGEVNAVATLRDKIDTQDIYQSAVDWTVANIGKDILSGNSVDPARYVAFSRGNQNWWYRPYERGLKDCFAAWTQRSAPYRWGACPASVDAAGRDQAEWIYLPPNHFPEGGVRGRFIVTVLDANAFVNLNDWLDDCNPTQCQMAHMIMDGYGEQELERYRSWRDGGPWNRAPEPNFAPLRYHEAWRVGSRTVRYLFWPDGYYDTTERLCNMASPNWVTTNQRWLSGYGAEMCSLKPLLVSDGIPTINNRGRFQTLLNNYFPPNVGEGFQQQGAGVGGRYMIGTVIGQGPANGEFSIPGGDWAVDRDDGTIGRMPFNLFHGARQR